MMHRFLQFTRDLFESEPVADTVGPVAAEKTGIFQEIAPLAQVGQSLVSIKNRANDKPVVGPLPLRMPLQQAPLLPATFRHPRASREVLFGEVLVAYEFKRSARRSIGFSVGASGLAVSAPKWLALRDVDQAVREKSGWILSKLRETGERHQRVESARIEWRDGAILPFLGEPLTVQLAPQLALSALQAETSGAQVAQTLSLALPREAEPEQIRQAVQAWLMAQAKPLFIRRLDHFAPHLGVQWRKLSLSSASTRWGSASTSGSIRLNWRLLHFKPAVIDYVVVHELSHLRVMDHSPRFWATVGAVMPNYAGLRAELKDDAIPHW